MTEVRGEALATFDITFADLRLAIGVAQTAKRFDIVEPMKVGLLLWIKQYERLIAAKVPDLKLLDAATSFAAWERALMERLELDTDEEPL